MYTEAMVERISSQLDKPQQLTTTSTINSPSLDFSKFNRGMLRFTTGTFGGTSPTLSAALQVQFSADNSTWFTPANITSLSATVTTASSEQAFEVRGDLLAQQGAVDSRNYQYARLQAVCTIGGTSPTIPVNLSALGSDSKQGPASQFNATGVAAPLQGTAS